MVYRFYRYGYATSMKKLICGKCMEVFQLGETHLCPGCGDECYDFSNNDEFLLRQAPKVIAQRKADGPEGLVGGLDCVIINTEPHRLGQQRLWTTTPRLPARQEVIKSSLSGHLWLHGGGWTLFDRNGGHFSRFRRHKGVLHAKTAIDVRHLGERSYRQIITSSAKRFYPARHAVGHWFKSSTAQW
jgi:hypothetical protein